MIPEIKPTADLVGPQRQVRARRPRYVTGLDKLPLGRVVNDAKVDDHHAIIPTKAEHDIASMGEDERDLRPRRESASWRSSTPRRSSSARASRPRSRTTSSARAGACCSSRAGRRSTARRRRTAQDDDDSGGDQVLPRSSRARRSRPGRSSRSARRRSRRGASPRPRSWARWRPPARTSRTPSCARR